MTIKFLPYLLLTFLVSFCTPDQPSENKKPLYAISSASDYATEAGLEILKNGGNAFDAAIAVASVLNVTEPMMSGLGGYGTILIYDAETQKVRYLNSSGRFPLLSNSDLMREPTPDFKKNRIGPKSISTPGNLNAWAALHSEYGTVSWNELFKSAIQLAEHGIKINEGLAFFIDLRYQNFSEYAKSIYGNDSLPLKEGDVLQQQDLANTYKLISEQGHEIFYKGFLADSIDKSMRKHDSFLRKKDLVLNEAEWWEPLAFSYKGYQVYVPSLPANSFPTLVNLGLMNVLNKEYEHNSVEYLHAFTESTKESYKARLAYSFDPEVKIAPLDSLLSEEVLKQWALSLPQDSASIFQLPFSEKSMNTTHFVVVDSKGNMVSATQTLGNLFGSGIMAEGTGIWLNNSMAYATYEPKGNPMDVFAGRRKLSGDSPAIIMKDGKPIAALGTPGGHTITQNVPQIIMNLIDYNMTMQESIDTPKISFVEPDRIIAESGIDEAIIEALKVMNHNIRTTRSFGNAHGILLQYNNEGEIDSLLIGEDQRGNSVREK